MSATATTVKAKDITWDEVISGEPITGIIEIDGIDYEIEIEGREAPSMWNRSPSNVRYWKVGEYAALPFVSGEVDGLRAAKREAIAALNAHLAAK